ncbi:hypothetical protein JX265_005236 [Neoarthrinium moseri]|uniref:Uncharacterized protein n=1 Tax=Neoarthrinium moseri TaxID=1658444 RepID=A0A9P9WPR0_9PEZI|nr:hypothetical protein JX265_005236 [Neoarthrinium moseri]
MAGTYAAVMQDDRDGYDGASPPMSLSPALSSSPFPQLPTFETTLTPLSMDSDTFLSHDAGDTDDGKTKLRLETPAAGTAAATAGAGDAAGLAQSVTGPARATVPAMEPAENEYELLSPSPGAVDADSSGPSSQNLKLGFSSPVRRAANTDTDTSSTAASPTSVRGSAGPRATRHQDPFPSLDINTLQQPTIVKPTPTPVLRTASTTSVQLVHPSPSVRSRSSSHASNIAQLEATAEILSMTSSIEDAIRDLHEEQKRSDSRRSSILAASTGSGPDYKETFPFARQVSGTRSILETNSAARLGGYSPAGYVMSPNHSLLSNPSRLRSGSYTRSEADSSEHLSRSGPGKGSTRSSKSTTKPFLTDIAEMEPSGLTLAAMDEADKLEEHSDEEETLNIPAMDDIDLTPNADQYGASGTTDYWGQAVAQDHAKQTDAHDGRRSPTGSTGTFELAEMAFADFDGEHCSPEAEQDPFDQPFDLDLSLQLPPEEERDPNRPRISRPTQPTVRPKSYMDPETGQQMLFYPARVPLMLNLPQKLSKKPMAAVRNIRRSQVLSAMPQANRQSAAWLPEVLPERLIDPLGSGPGSDVASPVPRPDAASETAMSPSMDQEEPQPESRPNPQILNEDARKSRMSVLDPSDKRKSRMAYPLENLPPQLRASAFFDMPSESPHVELKDGSAMATLDSILDASASAPVSAFTDHAFAGKLGSEVYGVDKKRKSQMKRASVSTTAALDVKKRGSFFHLRTPSKISIKSSSKDSSRNTITASRLGGDIDGESDDERTKLSGSVDGEPIHDDEEEEGEEEEEEESDEDPAAYGPPTTLLAELQIRKRQQKLRTRAPAQAYPNGMHSTLLEIDAVAELERKNRKGKKINLAWEEPNQADEESDDEDVPLGLLAAKKNGTLNAHTIQAEINRPLGLMERRNLEDNEPLSQRRNRLQGRPALAQRPSMMTLGGGALGMSGGLAPPSPSLRIQTPEEDEVEGETLAQRRRRLREREEGASALPEPRPLSSAFSVDLLNQLGDAFKDDNSAETGSKGKEKAAPAEEEETLGQRRRRLQAEREAREKEMGAGAGAALSPLDAPILTKRHSMADVLGASRKTVLVDPRADAENARQQEAERFKREQDQKLAGFRAQMPTSLVTPNLQRSGGYLAGQLNDGNAGGLGRPRVASNYAVQAPPIGYNGAMNGGGMMNGGMVGNGAYGAAGAGVGFGMQNVYAHNNLSQPNFAYGMPLQMQAMQVPMQQPGQQYDRVDRWRQSIVP